MKSEYDFLKGERGKFYDPKAAFNLPIYLTQVATYYRHSTPLECYRVNTPFSIDISHLRGGQRDEKPV
ncbi:MAG: hypothetical protein OXI63_26475 [Candidatus Poribacteria bacterium]|nr:hypothetical protein [Candidatus Poribacteria bacterium]